MLKLRIITATILIAVVFMLLWLSSPFPWAAFVVLAVTLGFKEWLQFCQINEKKNQFLAILMFMAFLAALFFYSSLFQQALNPLPIIFTSLFLWCFLLLYTFTEKPKLLSNRWVKLIVGMWLLVTSAWFLIELKQISNGHYWVLFLIAVISCADIGAYFTGRKFGKHKLAPSVSPGKTIEGLVGGLVVVAVVVFLIVFNWLSLDIGKACLLILCLLLTALVSVGGDLYESKLKRLSGIKDSSQILPGHGGILDRIDSLLAGLPMFLFAMYLGGYLQV